VNHAFETENAASAERGEALLEVPSRETVRQAIKRLDPYQVHVNHYGEASARKKFATVGRGLLLTRLLERVEMDEWDIDLITILSESGVLGRIMDDEKRALGLHRKKLRLKATVAICATTRCIAMRLSPRVSAASAIQTLDMITRDKGVWADAFSSLSP